MATSDTNPRPVIFAGRLPEEGGPGEVTVYTPSRKYTLDPRTDIANRSPSGLSWGFRGSGPNQLAIAFLAEVFGDEVAKADLEARKRLVDELIANFGNGFKVTATTIRAIAQHGRSNYAIRRGM